MSHIPRVFVDIPITVGATVELGDDKAHHLHKVLRLGSDAPVTLFNGDGNECGARVAHSERKAVTLSIETCDRPARESQLSITLAQGIARGDRMDFAIAKAVELGVHSIQPLFTERGKVRLDGARLQKKQAHWQRVAESAAEQSGRLMRPQVAPACTLADYLASAPDGLKLTLEPGAETGINDLDPGHAITLLIGPESGFSDAEISATRNAGFTAMRLGPRILRTETAGMAALAAIQGFWGDLG